MLDWNKCLVIWGAAVAEWLSSWLAEQEDWGSIPRLATWIFRDWLSPASKSRNGWKIAKSTLILKTTNQPTNSSFAKFENGDWLRPILFISASVLASRQGMLIPAGTCMLYLLEQSFTRTCRYFSGLSFSNIPLYFLEFAIYLIHIRGLELHSFPRNSIVKHETCCFPLQKICISPLLTQNWFVGIEVFITIDSNTAQIRSNLRRISLLNATNLCLNVTVHKSLRTKLYDDQFINLLQVRENYESHVKWRGMIKMDQTLGLFKYSVGVVSNTPLDKEKHIKLTKVT